MMRMTETVMKTLTTRRRRWMLLLLSKNRCGEDRLFDRRIIIL